MFLFDKLCKENEWTLIQNLAQKKTKTDHPPKHLFSAQEIDPLTAKVRAKKPPSPGREWIWFDRLWDPTVRIPSLISVLMENYLSMICIISLEKKSYKFHSNAIYKPSNLNERVYSIGKEIITLFFKGTWNQVQFLNSSRLCKIFKKSFLKFSSSAFTIISWNRKTLDVVYITGRFSREVIKSMVVFFGTNWQHTVVLW